MIIYSITKLPGCDSAHGKLENVRLLCGHYTTELDMNEFVATIGDYTTEFGETVNNVLLDVREITITSHLKPQADFGLASDALLNLLREFLEKDKGMMK